MRPIPIYRQRFPGEKEQSIGIGRVCYRSDFSTLILLRILDFVTLRRDFRLGRRGADGLERFAVQFKVSGLLIFPIP